MKLSRIQGRATPRKRDLDEKVENAACMLPHNGKGHGVPTRVAPYR